MRKLSKLAGLLISAGLGLSMGGAVAGPSAKWHLLNREPAIIRLDRCEGLLTGPSSAAACGHDYTIVYPYGSTSYSSTWCERVTGLDASFNYIKTWEGYCNSNPDTTNTLSLWGHILVYDVRGRIFDGGFDGPLVGHLK